MSTTSIAIVAYFAIVNVCIISYFTARMLANRRALRNVRNRDW